MNKVELNILLILIMIVLIDLFDLVRLSLKMLHRQKPHPNRAVLLRTVLIIHYLPTGDISFSIAKNSKMQKPQIDFLRFLCYNRVCD